jgi:UDP-2-acetamido-3-amino-2,3-dideoxy-glucuronate N-acetyltransferase
MTEMNVKYGKNVIIEEGAIVGYDRITKARGVVKSETVIGDICFIGRNAIIYKGCCLGKNVRAQHGVILRENTTVGDDTNLGHYLVVEGYTEIGRNCSIWGQSHVCAFSKIGDNVFIAPFFICTNDPIMDYRRPHLAVEHVGVTIHDNARIGANVTVLPGIVIGKEAKVGAGSLVTKDVAAYSVVFGVPAKQHGMVPEREFLK